CLARLVKLAFVILLGLHLAAASALVALRSIDPATTGVQLERRVEALIQHVPYQKRYTFIPLRRISPELQHAVIVAEDGRFYWHHGIDWKQVQQVASDSYESGEVSRGA